MRTEHFKLSDGTEVEVTVSGDSGDMLIDVFVNDTKTFNGATLRIHS